MNTDLRLLPDALLAIRRRLDLSQREISERTGLALSSIAAYERGERSPTVDSLDAWLAGVGVGLDELFEVLCELRGEPPRLSYLGYDGAGRGPYPDDAPALTAEEVATLRRLARVFGGMLREDPEEEDDDGGEVRETAEAQMRRALLSGRGAPRSRGGAKRGAKR